MVKLIAACLASIAIHAHAGYAQVSPPANWTESAGKYFYKAASNDLSFSNGVRGAAGVINVGGSAVNMPAAYRFAPNAARFAAGFAFGNPALLLGLGAASLAYSWYKDNNFEVVGGIWQKRIETVGCLTACFDFEQLTDPPRLWVSMDLAISRSVEWKSRQIVGFTYTVTSTSPPLPDSFTGSYYQVAMLLMRYNGQPYDNVPLVLNVRRRPTEQPGITYAPVTVEDFQNQMAPSPIPNGFPQVFPSPLPVEMPILNPSPAIVPLSEPLRVPQGQPQPVPDTNPQQWRTPATDIVPAPRLAEPWRVELQPKDIVRTEPTPLPDTASVPVTPPAGTTATQATPDLCITNPEILACQKVKLGELEPTPLDNENKSMNIVKDSGWGADNGSCPASRNVTVHGMQLAMPFDLLCQFANGIRPIVIGLAWLGAALTFFGFSRKN